MAFPTDANRNSTNGSAAVNKVCNLPSGIVAGDTLVLYIRTAGADTHTAPTDWTQIVLNNTADASDDTTSIFYRLAINGLGSTVTVTATANLKFTSMSWRVTGAMSPAVRSPEISTVAVGTNATPNPTAVAPTGGSKDYLFLFIAGLDGESITITTAPTNYVNVVNPNSGTGGLPATNNIGVGDSRQATTSSEDPGAVTMSGSPNAGWSAWVMALHPFDERLMRAMDRPWPDIVFSLPRVTASGMTPPSPRTTV